jgi:hypothetical protein
MSLRIGEISVVSDLAFPFISLACAFAYADPLDLFDTTGKRKRSDLRW